jgi:hypothetical protein
VNASVVEPAELARLRRVDVIGFVRPRKWLCVWAVVVAAWFLFIGIPTARPQIFAIVGFGLLASCAGQPTAAKRLVLDWAPLYFILMLYDVLRAVVASWLAPHALDQIRIDEWFFGGTVLTVRLQHAFYTPGVAHVWDYAAFLVYLSHFFVAIVVAAYLWKFAHARFRRFATLFVALTFAAFATYALYPAMPPWLASKEALLQPTARIIDEMWSHVGMANASAVFSGTGNWSNPVAAVPSLHAAYPMLLLLFFWPSAKRWRWLLVSYTLAMALTLIYTGEHYAIDIVLGWLYAVVVYIIGTRIFVRYTRRRVDEKLTDGAAADELAVAPRVFADR